MKTLEQVSSEILAEANRAQQMWGTGFDHKNTLNDWAAYVNIYLSHATSMGATRDEVMRGLRKAAGLVLNALLNAENDTISPRHYDGQSRPESLPEIKTDGVPSNTGLSATLLQSIAYVCSIHRCPLQLGMYEIYGSIPSGIWLCPQCVRAQILGGSR